ncbi:hypothetical protein pEaSNUABM5_00154 [Erwinia phage pEa_SNUABM_5]|uniref:Uncharacterized protein n=1 Tax=Erwinia phage pEa_SNUABM_5 TaxID=2797313 RepID=A0A7T8EPI1_9CAUD|nr:hypothetical protein MPK73_gp154 [Erwinia phage pEa_SNUABM_5]QQO90296.1 hypothetical protein pEaSNUABM5_00154 [Erwinia phage pEa_SNUABM_5]
MLAQVCLFDYWRNFVPYAPNLKIPAKNSEETRFSLRSLLLQGSRNEETGHSPTEGILDKVPAQRGWRLNAILLSETVRGTVLLDVPNEEIVYRPRSGYIGVDCCNYVLTNGTQQSNIAQINFEVYQWYQYLMRVYQRDTTGSRHQFVLNEVPTPKLDPVLYREFTWYYNQYRLELDAKGVKRVYKRRYAVAKTTANYTAFNALTATRPTIINQYDKVTYDTYLDTSLGPAFDGDTNIPFSPFGLQGDVEVEIKLYTKTRQVKNPTTGASLDQVDLSQPINILMKATDIYGQRWWESGNILI